MSSYNAALPKEVSSFLLKREPKELVRFSTNMLRSLQYTAPNKKLFETYLDVARKQSKRKKEKSYFDSFIDKIAEILQGVIKKLSKDELSKLVGELAEFLKKVFKDTINKEAQERKQSQMAPQSYSDNGLGKELTVHNTKSMLKARRINVFDFVKKDNGMIHAIIGKRKSSNKKGLLKEEIGNPGQIVNYFELCLTDQYLFIRPIKGNVDFNNVISGISINKSQSLQEHQFLRLDTESEDCADFVNEFRDLVNKQS